MKKNIFLTILFFANISFAQIPEIIETDPSTIYWENQSTVDLQQLNIIRALDYSSVDFHLKIYLHVLRRADGSGGQSVDNVNRMLQILYEDFDPLGINFVNRYNSINYIDNDLYYVDPLTYYPTIFNTYSHTNGIDIYLFDDLDSSYNGGAVEGIGQGTSLIIGGYAYFSNQKYFSPFNRTRFISQLMGKVFYLYNTHFGTNGDPNGCPELVDGSNCNDCGDYICDTPADPNIAFNNVNPVTCVFEPNLNDNIPDTDANGDPYRPDTSNIMSYSLPSCWDSFSPLQVLQMKNALGFIPHLQNTYLQNYIYIRPDIDCYSCNEQPKTFKVYSSYDLSSLYPISSTNIETEIIEQTSEYLTIKVTNLIGSGEGEPGNFSIVRSGRGIIETTQHIWVGLPQTIPDNTFTGNETAFAGQSMFHSIDNRINGIEFYGWDVPEPSQIVWGGEPVNNELWSHYGYDKYFLFTHANAGNQTGLVRPYGINPCGDGDNGSPSNEICVVNADDPEGDTECDPEPAPIYYYPNPANSLLEIDLSLQEYSIFDVYIYDEYQTVKYYDQSENVVKSVDTFNLTNGTYYLHIYNGSELILSAILIINH